MATELRIQALCGEWFPWERFKNTDEALKKAKFYTAQDYKTPATFQLFKLESGRYLDMKMGQFRVAFRKVAE